MELYLSNSSFFRFRLNNSGARKKERQHFSSLALTHTTGQKDNVPNSTFQWQFSISFVPIGAQKKNTTFHSTVRGRKRQCSKFDPTVASLAVIGCQKARPYPQAYRIHQNGGQATIKKVGCHIGSNDFLSFSIHFSHKRMHYVGPSREINRISFAAEVKTISAHESMAVRCIGRPRLRIERHMACAHKIPQGRSICAPKWAPQRGSRRFFLGALTRG